LLGLCPFINRVLQQCKNDEEMQIDMHDDFNHVKMMTKIKVL